MKNVVLKDRSGNALFPKAALGPIPEGAILCISEYYSAVPQSSLGNTSVIVSGGTWKQYGIFARSKSSRMKITVPAGEKWTIKFKTVAPMVEGGNGSSGNFWIGVGTVRLTGDNNTGAEWYDTGIRQHFDAYSHGHCLTETIQTFTAGTYYFGVFAMRDNAFHINTGEGNGATTTQPTRTGTWKRGCSVTQIATLVQKEKV